MGRHPHVGFHRRRQLSPDISKRLQSHPQEWLHSLQKNPAGFADLEKKVQHAFQQMADQLVAGLLAQATKGDDFADNAKKK
jgi:hypothetical protein